MQHSCTTNRKEAGFTLVELAIVMIIIGLLIGGILKGQELINNAKVASTIAQVKGISAAANTFQEQFRMLPGDMPGAVATARLPNCAAAPCNVGGDGNNRIGTGAVYAGVMAAGTENFSFFSHLNVADMLTGIDGSNNAFFGEGLPSANIGGGFGVGYANGAGAFGAGAANAYRGGNYLTIQGAPGGLGGATAGMVPSQALRFDLKLDDGVPSSGSVISSPGACITAGAGATTYSVVETRSCDLAIRL